MGISIHRSMTIGDVLIELEGVMREEESEPFNVSAVVGGVTIVDFSGKPHVLRSLVLKAADPGVATVTVRLSKLVNDVETVTDEFVIDSTNYDLYFELMDMFSDAQIYGDLVKIVCYASVGTIGVTGQYSYGVTID